MLYHIQNLYGCEGEAGGNLEGQHYKCNQFLRARSDEYVVLDKQNPSAFEIIATGKSSNEYHIKHGDQYLSYHTKMRNWIVVDDDPGMIWEILPRGGGYLIRSKFNCPHYWPCNQELTTGIKQDKFLWLESGWHQAFKIMPAE